MMMLKNHNNENNNIMMYYSGRSLYDDTLALLMNLQKKAQQSIIIPSLTTVIETKNSKNSEEGIFNIRNLFNLRMKQQKAEFITSWVFVVLLAIVLALGKNSKHQGDEDDKESSSLLVLSSSLDSPLPMAIYNLALLHFKVSSVYTRIFAFAIDFANTRDKFGAVKGNLMGLPSWLLYHHFGVYLTGLMSTYFLSPKDYFQALIVLVSLQSTNNTWTKKYSYVLYWGNVLVGVITSWYYVSLQVNDAFMASLCMMVSLLSAYYGAGLLAMQSFQCRTKKESS